MKRSVGGLRYQMGLVMAMALLLAPRPILASASPTSLVDNVTVQARQAGVGWRAPVSDGGSSGGDGSGRSLTDLRLTYDAGPDAEGALVYRLADRSGTWGDELAADGSASSVSGGIAGFRASLTGAVAERYDLQYRVSVVGVGWLGWTSNGVETGSWLLGNPLEAVCVRLAPKGAPLPDSNPSDSIVAPARLSVSGFVSGRGDIGAVPDGGVYGIDSLALHDLELSVGGDHRVPGGVSYRVNTGSWQPWVSGGSACPVIPDAPIFAVEVKLEGPLADCYDVWYRAHAIRTGWLGWTRDGSPAGTSNLGTYMDQVQVTLRLKGSAAPGSTDGPYLERVPIATVLGNVSQAQGWLAPFGGGRFDPSSSEGQAIQAAIAKVAAGGRQLAFAMVDLTTGQGLIFNADQAIYGASSIKGPYVVAINRFHPDQVSPSVRATMEECVSISCDDCYKRLRGIFGPQVMASMQDYSGGCSFTPYLNFPWLTARDLTKLWVGAYNYFTYEPNGNAAWCRDLFTTSYNSFIRGALGWKATTYTKPGWINYNATYLARNDAGIVMDGDRPYVVAILSTAYGRDGALEELTRAIDAVHASMVR